MPAAVRRRISQWLTPVAFAIATACGANEDNGAAESEAESEGEDCGLPLAATARFGTLVTLNVIAESPSLGTQIPPASSTILMLADFAQQQTVMQISTEICDMEIPSIALAENSPPITFTPHPDLVPSLPMLENSAVLSSAEICASIVTDSFAFVAGANLSAPDGTLPETCCVGASPPLCANTTCVDLACDQETDGQCGATFFTENAPVPIDQVHIALRTIFAFSGTAASNDRLEGNVLADEGAPLMEQSVVGCAQEGEACDQPTVNAVRALSPLIMQDPETPSTFLALRVENTMDCATLRQVRDQLFR